MDEVRRKIEEFQRSLEYKSPFEELLIVNPAVLPAFGLICGLTIQFYLDLPLGALLTILAASVILYFGRHIGLPKGRTHRFAPTIYDILLINISVFLCFACLGSIRLIKYNCPADNDIRAMVRDSSFAHIKAQIISEPTIIENNDWHFSKFYYSSAYTSFYAKITAVKTENGWKKAKGKLKFYISEKTEKLKQGDKFTTFCHLDKFSKADNPGQFDSGDYMNRNGVFFCSSVKSVNALNILESENIESFLRIKTKLNDFATARLNDGMEESNGQNLIEAMILGSQTHIDRKLYNDFIKTGLVHLICLSGLNVGIFAGIAWWLSKKAGLLHTGRSIASLIATIIFLLVVPAQASTLRAGIMFVIFCLSRLFFKRSSLLNCIAIAAILILLCNPMDFLSPGFQLSFGATVGIILFFEKFNKFLSSPLENITHKSVFNFCKLIIAAFSTSLAAWLFVAPVTAWHFFQVQLLTAIWTIPAMVPATLIIVLGTFKIILNAIVPTLAFALGYIINFCAWVFSWMVTIFAKVPLSFVIVGKTSIIFISAIYISLFMWKYFPFKSYGKRFIYPGIAIFLFMPVIFYNRAENLIDFEFTVLSVGHGQACVLSLPNARNAIIDAGSMSKSSTGTKIANAFLSYKAICRIDAVFISHDDIDHFNGLPEVTAVEKCGNFYTTPQLIQSDSATAKELKKLFALKQAPAEVKFGKASIRRLWPIDEIADYSDNESSLVLLVEYRGRKILLTSDVTADVQKKIMELYPRLDIDLMVTPHHGSGKTTYPAFINYFKPEHLVTSCSDVQFERTIPEIRNFANSFFTCRDGAVTVSINKTGKIKITTFVSSNF
ncbi:MAG: ComEC family competence protein [Planctomycetes bacterium ADurb.Bin401]|nr:MAG: ComEC family competence protein [Planctomycetes bacterium ADurb.Bin401]